MKKEILLLIMGLIFFSNSVVMAGERVEFNGGVTYNNFVYSEIDNGNLNDDYWVRESLNSGTGFYLEGLFWLGSKWGIGGGIDRASSSWSSFETYADSSRTDYLSEYYLDGYYGKLSYKLSDEIRLSVGISNHNFAENYMQDNSWEDGAFNEAVVAGDGLGYLLEAQVDYPVNDHIALMGSVGYRRADIDVKEVYNWNENKLVDSQEDNAIGVNGLRAGINLALKF
ncbi:hypothetical protein U472_03025 [Orenia metallireducens]|jgi:hypothetical protein|uniref:Outer membrane protein beta-barrel domain-containing protein n=1 Tax=Orenia metallireducens TaxID=1413210 RepID=A0A1C0AB13_9FIRM|nr:hypothetical protein [Orenia metallireducens]OCL27546.1 hypothetical protein U472_03025 [Orenia metallireducens]